MPAITSSLRTPCLVVAFAAAVVLPAAATPVSQDRDLVNIDFRGGTVGEYIQQVRREVPHANILLMDEARTVPVPAMKLQNVTVGAAIEVLQPLTRQSAVEHVRIMTDTNHRPPGTAVYSIMAKVDRVSLPQQTRVLAVGHILAGNVEPEALLTAIETGLSLFGEEYDAAELRFHRETGLVIARGHPAQITMVAEVIDQVYDNVKTSREQEAGRQSMIDMEQRVASLETALARARSRAETHRMESTDLRTQAEVLTRQLDRSMESLAEREAESAAFKIEIVELRTALADARSQLDGRKERK